MSDASKIDAYSVKCCSLPPPSAELFRAMAIAGYESNRDGTLKKIDRKGNEVAELDPWDRLDPDFQDTLILEAKAMYGALALAARALCTAVPPEPKDPPIAGSAS